jgi:hypothetical protein
MSYIGASPTNVAFQTDTFSGTGSQTAFTMAVAPASTTSVLVAITGVVQDPSTYSVVGTTLTFSAAPPTGTNNISVRYLGIPASGVTTTAYRTVTNFTATAGQTTFSVPSYTVGYIDVYRNGVRLAAADYTATNGTTVVLTNAATVGDSVVTESFYVSSVLNAIPATAGAVNTTYLAGGAALGNIGAGGLTQTYLGANVAGNGPAFSAYTTVSQSLTSNTDTKFNAATKEYDTASCYNTSNSRFTPTVAGYYQINMTAKFTASSGITQFWVELNKSGTLVSIPSYLLGLPAATVQFLSGSTLVYMNGTTDYLEFWGGVNGTSPATGSTSGPYATTGWQGFLVRAA